VIGRRVARVVERAELVGGEPVPAVGDVLELAPVGQGTSMAVRVKRVRGRDVWYVGVSVERGPLGGGRWVFLPPARRWGPERLKRRTA
jgi:hypothetical protein